MLAVPLTACGGGTTSDGDGGGGQKDGQTFDVISTGCAPTSSPTCGCPPPTTITYVKCDPDAGPMDAGADAGCFATCGQACIAQNHPSNICTDQGTDGGLTTTTCQVGCGVPAVTINMVLLEGNVSEMLDAIARYRPDLLHCTNHGDARHGA